MKEFVDKLIGRLEEERKEYTSEYGLIDMQVQEVFVNVRKIVNKLAEEHIHTSTDTSSGWIPCSSGNFSTSEVLVCKEDGTIDFDVFDFMYEDWKFNSNHHKNKVIAWQPLPQPYKEKSTSSAEWKQHLLNRFEGGSV